MGLGGCWSCIVNGTWAGAAMAKEADGGGAAICGGVSDRGTWDCSAGKPGKGVGGGGSRFGWAATLVCTFSGEGGNVVRILAKSRVSSFVSSSGAGAAPSAQQYCNMGLYQ